jgi:hypothetical protein
MYNSLRLLFAFDKRQPHVAADKMLTFFAVVKRRFYKGVLRKCVFLTWCFCGEVVVDCW